MYAGPPAPPAYPPWPAAPYDPFAAPPPPLTTSEPMDIDYEEPPEPPPDRQAPLVFVPANPVVLSTADPLPELVQAFDAEGSLPITFKRDGYDLLQLYHASETWRRTLPFDSAWQAYGPHDVVITATDAANNAAAPVAIRTYLAQALCPQGDVLCDTGNCSEGGMCPGKPQSAKAEEAEYVPPADTQPPVIRLNENSATDRRVIAPASGDTVIETTLQVGSAFVDPGAQAFDIVDGALVDLSSRVARFGLKAVTTALPTPPATPHIIKYDVSDAAGNAAATRIRRVFVHCPANAKLCSAEDAPVQWYCSDSSTLCFASSGSREAAAQAPVVVQLNGPDFVQLALHSTYVACSPTLPLSVTCDRCAACLLGSMCSMLHFRHLSLVCSGGSPDVVFSMCTAGLVVAMCARSL